MNAVVEMRGASLAYRRGEDALSGVDLQVSPGEVIGLLGQNGAGKTTLLNLVLGNLAPRRGSVRVFGRDPRRETPAVRRRVGFVSEDQQLPTFLTVAQVLELHAALYPTWDRDSARELVARFELPPDRRISTLSKGQARQTALVGAVACRPELLVLDEPGGGLDPAVRREFLEASIRLLAEQGTTILFSSHHLGDVNRLASRLVMLHRGQKWIDSRLDDIREGFCLAQIPPENDPGSRALLQLDGCLCVRRRDDAVRAVFQMEPRECAQMLRDRFDLTQVHCAAIPLEEMFIEIVGGDA